VVAAGGHPGRLVECQTAPLESPWTPTRRKPSGSAPGGRLRELCARCAIHRAAKSSTVRMFPVSKVRAIGAENGATPAQTALAWLLTGATSRCRGSRGAPGPRPAVEIQHLQLCPRGPLLRALFGGAAAGRMAGRRGRSEPHRGAARPAICLTRRARRVHPPGHRTKRLTGEYPKRHPSNRLRHPASGRSPSRRLNSNIIVVAVTPGSGTGEVPAGEPTRLGCAHTSCQAHRVVIELSGYRHRLE